MKSIIWFVIILVYLALCSAIWSTAGVVAGIFAFLGIGFVLNLFMK